MESGRSITPRSPQLRWCCWGRLCWPAGCPRAAPRRLNPCTHCVRNKQEGGMGRMQSIMQDVRYALRQLRKSPGFAITVIAVLALGIGANIAVFTILNGVLLRPLPYTHSDRVVAIELSGAMPYYTMTYANMLQLRDAAGPQMKIGGEIYGEGGGMFSVVGPGGRFQVSHVSITAGLFNMLGVEPIIGRTFREEENEPGDRKSTRLN